MARQLPIILADRRATDHPSTICLRVLLAQGHLRPRAQGHVLSSSVSGVPVAGSYGRGVAAGCTQEAGGRAWAGVTMLSQWGTSGIWTGCPPSSPASLPGFLARFPPPWRVLRGPRRLLDRRLLSLILFLRAWGPGRPEGHPIFNILEIPVLILVRSRHPENDYYIYGFSI